MQEATPSTYENLRFVLEVYFIHSKAP